MCSNHTGVDFFAPIKVSTDTGDRRTSGGRCGWGLESWARLSVLEVGFFAGEYAKRGWREEVGLCERFFLLLGIFLAWLW